MQDWSRWVLDHSLPLLPGAVAIGESVPIARWPGPKFGAVLHVQWSWSDAHDDDQLQTEIDLFRRRHDAWEPSLGGGGGGWFDPPFDLPPVAPREAELWHFHWSGGDDWRAVAAYGRAGADIARVVVDDRTGSFSFPLESPLGVFIICADATQESVVTLLDVDERPVMEERIAREAEV